MRAIPIQSPSGGFAAGAPTARRPLRVALVGAPNVGKSSLFQRLTGHYATVSNYPGTSVELMRGHARLDGVPAEIVDTPGMRSLLPATEEERVTRVLLVTGDWDILVHVVDAKNLTLQLPLTLQLLELGRPLVLALNVADEAERLGLRIAHEVLARTLGIPVVPVVAVEGRGVAELRRAVLEARSAAPPVLPEYPNGVGGAIRASRAALAGRYPVDPVAIGALVLQGDPEIETLVTQTEPDGGAASRAARREAAARLDAPPAYRVAVERQRVAEQIARTVIARESDRTRPWVRRLGELLGRPLVGIPVLLAVLYLGLYQFVGVLGGGVVVDWIEGTLFERHVNPFLERLFLGIPWDAVRALYVGEYGLLTLGLRYAVAIILPIVGAFFLFFSVLEDSGYFPRLALLLDRALKRLGLSGRAVIPMVLGFACDTMATMVTRTLESRRERVLATLLLALAIPCSAQLGVILALLAGNPLAMAAWTVAVAGTFVAVGWLGARLLPGRVPTFQMELPPLRRPRLANVLTKTLTRMQWYFLEVLPLFLLASVILWAMDLTGLFAAAVRALAPLLSVLGLPPEAAHVFLLGFFRRDYGAAGLFDLSRQGVLDPIQVAVAGVTLTLFVPCVAQLLMMIKERGVRTALAMVAFITPVAFGVGALVNVVLRGIR